MKVVMRTFTLALCLSLLEVVSSVLFFTREVPIEIRPQGASVGYISQGDEINFPAGAKVLLIFIRDPKFAFQSLSAQFFTHLTFLWIAALAGTRIRPERNGAKGVFSSN